VSSHVTSTRPLGATATLVASWRTPLPLGSSLTRSGGDQVAPPSVERWMTVSRSPKLKPRYTTYSAPLLASTAMRGYPGKPVGAGAVAGAGPTSPMDVRVKVAPPSVDLATTIGRCWVKNDGSSRLRQTM
jgi:hypothetical protein